MHEKINGGHNTNFIPLNTSNVPSVTDQNYPTVYVRIVVIIKTPWSFHQKKKKRNNRFRSQR
jgi:hypothetical protein